MNQQFNLLEKLLHEKSLPHSWLLLGSINLSLEVVEEFVSKCLKINIGAHPDYININQQDSVKIADIRRLTDFAYEVPQIAEYKVIIICNAQNLSIACQNAFLKTLEEPANKTLIFLLAENYSNILPTVLSRCQFLDFRQNILQTQAAIEYDVKIIEQLCDLWVTDSVLLTNLVDTWSKLDFIELANSLYKMLAAVIKAKCNIDKFDQKISELANILPEKTLFSLSDKLCEFKLKYVETKQLNTELFLYSWLSIGLQGNNV